MSNEQFEAIMNQMKMQDEKFTKAINALDEKFTKELAKQINTLDKKFTKELSKHTTILNSLKEDVEVLKEDVSYIKEEVFNVKDTVSRIRPEVIYIRRTQEEAIKNFKREVAINKKQHGDILHIVDERDLIAENDRQEIHKELTRLKAKIG